MNLNKALELEGKKVSELTEGELATVLTARLHLHPVVPFISEKEYWNLIQTLLQFGHEKAWNIAQVKEKVDVVFASFVLRGKKDR